jgi:hypothetical protein
MPELPIACTLDPAALAARRQGFLADLLRHVEEHRVEANTYLLRFPSTDDTLAAIARAVDAERQCCRFVRFRITVEPDGGPIWHELSGPPGTGEFLSALLES